MHRQDSSCIRLTYMSQQHKQVRAGRGHMYLFSSSASTHKSIPNDAKATDAALTSASPAAAPNKGSTTTTKGDIIPRTSMAARSQGMSPRQRRFMSYEEVGGVD